MGRRLLTASEPESLRLCAGEGSVRLTAAADADGKKLATFEMDLYSGAPMTVGYYGRVIVDLQGLRISNRPVPVLLQHDPSRIVGHGRAEITDGKVVVKGTISGGGTAAAEVRESGKNGFPWQASIGADPRKTEEVKAGAQAFVNGRPVAGPITIVRQADLREASFVPVGADPDTASRVAATFGRSNMDPKFVEWLTAKGFDKPEALSEAQVASLKAAYDAEQGAAKPEPKDGDGKAKEPAGAVPPVAGSAPSAADALKAERARIAGIEAACKGDWSKEGAEKVAGIRASAIAEGQAVAEVNAALLKLLRASRPAAGAPVILRGHDGAMSAQLLVAALCVANRGAVRMDDAAMVREFGERTVEGAHKLGSARLTEVIEAACALDGINLPRFGRGGQEWIRAAFSSITLTGILGAVANKSLLAGYQAIKPGIRRIFKRGSVSNFQTHTRYRLTGTGTFEKMAPSGELQHGRLAEQTYTQKADTYGKFFQLTRQDVVNDDPGAFLQIPGMLGRGWATAIEEAGVTLLLSNPSSFFSASPTGYAANYASGAGSALTAGVSAINALVALFLGQVDNHSKPVMVEPRFMVVPPALMAYAEQYYKTLNLDTIASSLGSTSSRVVEQQAGANIHAGKYEPICIPQLAASAFTGYSATAWYLFADPDVLAAFEVAYLNGQEMPTIESVGVAPDTLGIAFRGYGDFGVAAVDPRAACKSAGA